MVLPGQRYPSIAQRALSDSSGTADPATATSHHQHRSWFQRVSPTILSNKSENTTSRPSTTARFVPLLQVLPVNLGVVLFKEPLLGAREVSELGTVLLARGSGVDVADWTSTHVQGSQCVSPRIVIQRELLDHRTERRCGEERQKWRPARVLMIDSAHFPSSFLNFSSVWAYLREQVPSPDETSI